MKAAQDESRQLEPFASQLSGFDVPAAYEVAHLIHAARLAEGAVAVGRKVGFTNPEMWALYADTTADGALHGTLLVGEHPCRRTRW
jgi:2-oxo-3-hexenedioate decarboxylase